MRAGPTPLSHRHRASHRAARSACDGRRGTARPPARWPRPDGLTRLHPRKVRMDPHPARKRLVPRVRHRHLLRDRRCTTSNRVSTANGHGKFTSANARESNRQARADRRPVQQLKRPLPHITVHRRAVTRVSPRRDPPVVPRERRVATRLHHGAMMKLDGFATGSSPRTPRAITGSHRSPASSAHRQCRPPCGDQRTAEPGQAQAPAVAVCQARWEWGAWWWWA